MQRLMVDLLARWRKVQSGACLLAVSLLIAAAISPSAPSLSGMAPMTVASAPASDGSDSQESLGEYHGVSCSHFPLFGTHPAHDATARSSGRSLYLFLHDRASSSLDIIPPVKPPKSTFIIA